MESIIKRIKEPGFFVNSHIAAISGEETIPAPRHFENLENGERYSYIAGGIGLPGKAEPGCALIVAVDRGSDSAEPVFRALDMAEDRSLTGLLRECVHLREKYGYGTDPELFTCWTVDHERAWPIFSRFNDGLAREKKDGIYPTPPSAQWGQPHACECYLRNVFDMLSARRLKLGACPGLKNYIQALPPEGVGESLPDRYPALAALSFVVTTLLETQPWMRAFAPEPTGQTLESETLAAMDEQDAFDFGDEDEYDDDGGLINTV